MPVLRKMPPPRWKNAPPSLEKYPPPRKLPPENCPPGKLLPENLPPPMKLFS